MTRHIVSLSLALAVAAGVGACKKDQGTTEQPAASTALPAGHPSIGSQDLPAPPSGKIDGTLAVADAVKGKVAAGDTIYVMARNAATGTLIAVTKVAAPPQFPAPFELTGEIKHADTSLAGKVKLEARVDKDGDPMTKNPGDVVGEAKDLVTVPSQGVVVTLDRVLE